jgi:hypothetical protein
VGVVGHAPRYDPIPPVAVVPSWLT